MTTRERIDLAGAWQLAFDPHGERSETVQIPSVWNVTHPDADGVGYYRRTVALPEQWAGRVVRLHVGGASYRLEAWLNGRYVGSHEGSYTPCRFDVTAAARPGDENELLLRVTSLSRTRAVDGMALPTMPASKQTWYYAYGGLWGDVSLEAVPALFCESIAVEPNLRLETALFDVTIANTTGDGKLVELALTVTGPNGAVAAAWRQPIAIPPGTPRFDVLLRIPHPSPWSCEQPNLYQVRAALLDDGQEIDGLDATFGMRDFTASDGRFFLNGEQIYLRGILLQPNYPIGLIAPVDPSLPETEVRLSKEAGFNLIRIHIRPAVPGFLDLTDRMGMLVYAESSLAWIRDSPRLLDHGRREVTALIERDRNHPSVVFWGIFNEHRKPAERYADPLIRTARALDPTRVIVDNSGGTMAVDQDFGWADRTTVVPNRETERVPFHDLHLYIGAPVTRAACEWLRTLGMPQPPVDIAALGFGSPPIFDEWYRELQMKRGQIFVSELGCGGMGDVDEVAAGFGDRLDLLDAREHLAFRDSLHEGFATRGLDRIFDSVRDLIVAAQEQQATGNRRQIEALLTNGRVSGYLLTQLNDVSCEFHAGIVDLWRRPKLVFEELKRLNHARCLVVRSAVAVVATGDAVDVTLTLVDRDPTPGGEQIVVTIADPSGRDVASTEYVVPPGKGIKEFGAFAVETGSEPGEYRVSARLLGASDRPVTADESILALPAVEAPEIPSGVSVVTDPGSLTESAWDRLLDTAESGETVVIGPLRPKDEMAIRMLSGRGLDVQLHFGFGNWMGTYHWAPASDLFAGLPAGGLAGEAYADVLPQYILTELGGDVLAGSFRNTETRRDVPKMLWFSDVESVQLGRGRLIFCQYRIFNRSETGPLAGRMLRNLLGVAGTGS